MTMAKNASVFGIFLTRGKAESAVDALQADGFSNSDVSLLLPENICSEEVVTEQSTKAPEGAVVGVGSGVAVGGALGWLVGAGALARWQFRALVRLSQPAQSWRLSLALGSAAPWEGSPEPW